MPSEYPEMMSENRRGLLIAIEGIDGAGKTTQVEMLTRFLRDHGDTVIRSKEPTEGPWGKMIRDGAAKGRLPVDEELAAFIEDRREHVRDIIAPGLAAGSVVILDRYFYSTIAYQGVRGAPVADVTRSMVDQFPIPDVVFLIDVNANIGLSRVSVSRGDVPNAFETADNLRLTRALFREIYESGDHKNIVLINGTASIDRVHSQILRTLLEGPLKPRYCAKSYGCDDAYLCGPRITGECQWANMCQAAGELATV